MSATERKEDVSNMDKKICGGSDVEAQPEHLEVSDDNADLSEEHRGYLLARHGTLELDPVPDMNDADPFNWGKGKKTVTLVLVAFHAMMGTFTAAAILCAFSDIAKDLDVSLQSASYLTSLVIAILGGGPLLWRPIADRFGRRPVFLVSLLVSLVGNIGCAISPSYGTMGLCRAITALAICPAGGIGSGVVAEMFFKKDRAFYMGIWTLMVTVGVPVAPFIFGFLALRVSYRWIYYVLAMVNAVQFLLYFFLGPETRYMRGQPAQPAGASSFQRQYLGFRRIDPTPLRLGDFLHPLTLFRHHRISIPAAAYAMVFSFASVLTTVEIPQLYAEAFGLDTQAIGLQFLAVVIGSVVGEQVGGVLSDRWMRLGGSRRSSSRGQQHAVGVGPEFRLWLAYPGYLLAIAGIVVFMVQMGDAGTAWNVTPTVGAGVAAAGNQIVTTVLITYAVDCYRMEAASIGVFVTFVRQTWGFIGPFWFPQMITNAGFSGAAGITTGLMVAVSILPTIFLQWRGRGQGAKQA